MGIINILDSSHFVTANNRKMESSYNFGEFFARSSRRAGLFISNTGLFPAIIGNGKSNNHWK